MRRKGGEAGEKRQGEGRKEERQGGREVQCPEHGQQKCSDPALQIW